MSRRAYRLPTQVLEVLIPVITVLVALLLGAGLMLLVHKNPILAYRALWNGAFGSIRSVSETLVKATPLILTGLAVAFGFTSGVFNVGGEGQLLTGALAAAWVGYSIGGLPRFVHVPLALTSSAAIGALWALVPAIMKVACGAHEVITTIMMNWIAIYIVHYLVIGPLKAPGELPATPFILKSATLNRLLPEPSRLSTGILVAVACAILVFLVLRKTVLGYEVRAVGKNQDAAAYAGINVPRTVITSMLVSGMLAGLAGGVEVLGLHRRFYDAFSPGYGFDGIPIALLARNNPLGVLITALLFGALRNGASSMQIIAGIPKEIVVAVQGLIIVLIAGENLVRWAVTRRVRSGVKR